MNRDNPHSFQHSSQGRRNQYSEPLPDGVSSFVKNESVDPAVRLRKYRPTLVKKTTAWVGVAIGVMMVIGTIQSAVDGIIGDVMIGIGMTAVALVPSIYWLRCNHRDSRIVSEWVRTHREYQVNWEMLATDEREMFARPEELPVIPLRRWKTVAYLIVAAFLFAMVGSILSPETPVA